MRALYIFLFTVGAVMAVGAIPLVYTDYFMNKGKVWLSICVLAVGILGGAVLMDISATFLG